MTAGAICSSNICRRTFPEVDESARLAGSWLAKGALSLVDMLNTEGQDRLIKMRGEPHERYRATSLSLNTTLQPPTPLQDGQKISETYKLFGEASQQHLVFHCIGEFNAVFDGNILGEMTTSGRAPISPSYLDGHQSLPASSTHVLGSL